MGLTAEDTRDGQADLIIILSMHYLHLALLAGTLELYHVGGQ